MPGQGSVRFTDRPRIYNRQLACFASRISRIKNDLSKGDRHLDRFAQIAFAGGTADKEQLTELEPPKLTHRYFRAEMQQMEWPVQTKDRPSLEAFQDEVKSLKEKYRRFLYNGAPAPVVTRRCWEQKEFAFRYETAEDRADFTCVMQGSGEWEAVSIPDYRGPVGQWTGFYRSTFAFNPEDAAGKRIFLCFQGVDYIANIYVNGRYIGSHEGFFAEFEFDVTKYISNGVNVLVVEVKNDAPTIGLASWSDRSIDGDKLYAATGPGWDDPEIGWHHCPPGAGIYHRVLLEARSPVFVRSLFIKPDIDTASAEAWIEVFNTGEDNTEFQLSLSVFPLNFPGEPMIALNCPVQPAGPGINDYRFTVPLPGYRLWRPDEPWLYVARAAVKEQDGLLIDEYDSSFGMRKFHMDETEEPKGRLYLNNEPVMLRGANDMGHMQLCVMRGDTEQLIEDIMIAKLANMNYYRFTQRPVQREIYDICDRLGMMNQTDFPLFGYLRRNQFAEALRQCGEMERHIRRHASAIMISYINEPSSVKKQGKEHRHLLRNELEDFFEAADRVVRLENPDRVIKRVEGDYEPPTRTGLSDFHCYTMWYTNHALPIGKLHKGYLPAMKQGWLAGCGEFGTEGLDPLETMLKDYPDEWLPVNLDAAWTPERISKSQTYSMHGDWYGEQQNISDWIEASQAHQALATKWMTDALRRRADRIVSTAVHLLIDAWPAGWTKALVDHNRTPKPAYFALQKAYKPVRIHWRTDRLAVYSGEPVKIEAWALNDSGTSLVNYQVAATAGTSSGKHIGDYGIDVDAAAVMPTYAGTLVFNAPEVSGRESITVEAMLTDSGNAIVDRESIRIDVFPREASFSVPRMSVYGPEAEWLTAKLNVRTGSVDSSVKGADASKKGVILIGSLEDYAIRAETIEQQVANGAAAIILCSGAGTLRIGGSKVEFRKMNELTFVSLDRDEALANDFQPSDFSFFYNEDCDHIDTIAHCWIEGEAVEPVVFTYEKPSFMGHAKGRKRKLPVVGRTGFGQGQMVFCALRLRGFSGVNPVLDRFIKRLLISTDGG